MSEKKEQDKYAMNLNMLNKLVNWVQPFKYKLDVYTPKKIQE